MKKKLITFLSIVIVASSFFGVAQDSGALINVKAETQATTTTQKPAEEQEYDTTSTTASTTSSTSATSQPTTESTTKSDGNKEPSATERPTIIDWGKLTTTKKNEEDKADVPSEKPSEDTTENEPVSEDASSTKPSTTKKKTTTKKYKTTTVPKITIPVVDNTQVEGTTLSPLDAYFERISDSSEADTYFFDEPTTEGSEEEEERNLSTGAIVAICIGGIAVVTCALTGLFVLRNKKAAESDDDVEYDDEYEEEYETDDAQNGEESTASVDNTGSFKVVDFNSENYK